MHRCCAGLSARIFAKISNNSDESEPFLCVYCVLANQAAKIKQLKDSLNSVLSHLPSQNSTAHPPSTNPAANALQPQNNNLSQDISDDDLRKHNVVIFGIEECASGTDKLERVKHDFCKVLDVCSAIDTSRTSGSAIRHTVLLGKYSSSPRPILVKFNSTAYASNLLTNKKQCPEGINLISDLPLQVRQTERYLLVLLMVGFKRILML